MGQIQESSDLLNVRTLLEVSQSEALLRERNTIPRMRKYRRLLDYLYTTVHVDAVRHT